MTDRAPKVSPLEPVERLSGRVYRALRTSIRSGQIVPGHRLQEVQLSTQLGVSRTPVREALARLANEGLVKSDGRSFVVPSLTLEDIDDIYELRLLIEPAALRDVANRANDLAVQGPILRALEDSISAHRRGDAHAFIEANARFRTAWLSRVANERLVYAVQLYADHVQQLRALTLGNPKVRTIVLKGLRRIAAALAAGDGEAAADAMRDHLTEAKKAFIGAMALTRPGRGSGERSVRTA